MPFDYLSDMRKPIPGIVSALFTLSNCQKSMTS